MVVFIVPGVSERLVVAEFDWAWCNDQLGGYLTIWRWPLTVDRPKIIVQDRVMYSVECKKKIWSLVNLNNADHSCWWTVVEPVGHKESGQQLNRKRWWRLPVWDTCCRAQRSRKLAQLATQTSRRVKPAPFAAGRELVHTILLVIEVGDRDKDKDKDKDKRKCKGKSVPWQLLLDSCRGPFCVLNLQKVKTKKCQSNNTTKILV